jgi:hypothetical protein
MISPGSVKKLFLVGDYSFMLILIPSRIQRISFGKEEAPQSYYSYVEEADDAANKVSQRSEAHPERGAQTT